MTKDKNFEVINGKLTIAKREISLSVPVEKAVEVNSLIVVMLSFDDYEGNRNIFAFDQRGRSIWQIQESPYGGDVGKPFVRLRISDEGDLIAGDFTGIDYKVNLSDGTLGEVIAFNRF